jgi:hypothetical protein
MTVGPAQPLKRIKSTAKAAFCGALVLASAGASPPAAAQTTSIYCDQFARNYAQNASRQGQVLGGGAVGSLVGLGIGAIAGASGVGAAIGLGVGMIGGGTRRQSTADHMYSAAYQDCKAGRIR